MAGAELFAPFVDRAARAAVLLDFDGTLAPIVEHPADARPAADVVEVLPRLVDRFGLVAVISGRPVSFLEPLLPPGVVISGLYGLEVLSDGHRSDHPGAGAWREAVADVARSSSDRGPAGMVVESKGLSLTLHYRSHPELEPAVREWAEQQAARSGLEVRSAKMSVELHPPVQADKGTALASLVQDDFEAVCFVGDDLGDLPAYDALDRLAENGVHVVRVAVGGAEAPPKLLGRADVVVEAPEDVAGLLLRLAGESTRTT
ncbi:MAG TPA: trehalose-phosphatase [Acidimicrobiales bacterium]